MAGGSGDGRRCCKFKWKNLAPRKPRRTGCCIFFLERERRRAGIDLSSLPISLKFQINKIHFSAPLPSPPQQTKEKQFPAVCSKLLSPSLSVLQPLSYFRSFLTSASCSHQRLGDPQPPKEGTP